MHRRTPIRAACASRATDQHSLAVCAFEISAAEKEIQLIPAGPFRAVDGRPKGIANWYLDTTRFAAWLAQSAKKQTRLAFDFEHESLPAEDGRRRKWTASAWVAAGDIEIRDGAVWATQVEWTAAAAEHINQQGGAYISPVFIHDKTGAIYALCTHTAIAALTNTPAIDGMAGVLRAAANQHAPEPHQMEKLIEMLGLAPEATEEDIAAAVAALQQALAETQEQALAATAAASAGPDPAQYVPVGVVEDLRQDIAALRQERNDDQVTSLIAEGLADGRLLPAQKAWAESLGKKDVAALSQYLATAKPIAGLRNRQTGGEPPGTDGPEGLTESQLAVCTQLGIPPAEYAKTLKESH